MDLTPRHNGEIVVSITRQLNGKTIIVSRGHAVPTACAGISTLLVSMYYFLQVNVGPTAQVNWNGPKGGVLDLIIPPEFMREADYLIFSLRAFAKTYPAYLRVTD